MQIDEGNMITVQRAAPSDGIDDKDDIHARLPLPPFPAGWYGVAFSEEIAAGAVKPLRFAGREVVAFRTASGRAAIFEAYCPHLGAHFGHGGCVVGETLRCPMHHFHFDCEGACTKVGAPHTRPPAAKAGVVHARESAGVLLAWHHPRGAPPAWEPPALVEPPFSLGPAQRRRVLIRSHVQDLAENLFDGGHLVAVHGYEEPELDPRPAADGPVLCGRTRFYSRGGLGPFERRVRVEITNRLYGLGIVVFDSVANPGGLAVRGAFTPNPIAPGLVEFLISVWIARVDDGLANLPIFRWLPERTQLDVMGRLLAYTLMRDVRQDQAVLERKRHLARPGFADGDGAIPAFRRWARQFY